MHAQSQVIAYEPIIEDSMTFQVALIGNNGLVVGSDRKVAQKTQHSMTRIEPGDIADWQFMTGEKFKRRKNDEVICVFSGGPQADTIARDIVLNADYTLEEVAWEAEVMQIAEQVNGNSDQDQVLIIRQDTPDRLISLTRNNDEVAILPVRDHICAGTNVYARFLAQDLWQKTTVSSLKNLVLLSLIYAAKEFPATIGNGFDVVTLRTDKHIEWDTYEPDDPRLKELEDKFSRGWW